MGPLIRIIAVAGRQWPWMLAGITLAVAVVAANALLMALSGWFIASMAVAGVQGAAFNYVVPAAAIRGLAIARTVGRYIERLVTHEAAFRVLAQLRVWFFRRVEPLAPALLERYASGDVAGRLRHDVDALESLYLRIILPVASGGVAICLAALFVAWWSPPAAAALLLFLLGAGLFLPLLARTLARAPGQRSVDLAGELRTAVTEGIQGSEELLLLGAAELQANRVEELSMQLVEEQERLARISGLAIAGGTVCGGLGVAAVLASAGWSVGAGELAGPVLVMLILFAAAAFEAASGMPGALSLIPGARASIRRIRELADASLPVPEPALPAPAPVGTEIVLRNVSYAYDQDQPVLKEFNLQVAAGERVALAGPSGVGKSTISQLLLGFRPYQGSITIGGTELADLSSDDIHRLIAAVPQRPHLFNATIRENIVLADPDAGEEQVRRAVEDALLAGWIGRLPDGLETRVGEGGSGVSGGEARRIALARALLQDAPIVILDEPTEGLDLAMEKEVVGRLADRLAGKTVLVISHRPACLALADRVVWMT